MSAKQIDVLLAGVRTLTGAAAAGYLVYTYAAGTNTAKTTWTDKDKATPATNPITLDAYGRAQVYAEGIYKLLVKTPAGATVYTWDNLKFGVEEAYWVDVADYASFTAAITAIGSTKCVLLVNSATTVTAATSVPATCQVVITPAGSLTKSGSGTVTFSEAPSIPPNHVAFSGFSAGNIVIPAYSNYAADTGGADAYVISLPGTIPAHITGLPIAFKAKTSNTGASTIAVNGLAAVAIRKDTGTTALEAGDIVAGQIYEVVYDGTYYQLLNNGLGVRLDELTGICGAGAVWNLKIARHDTSNNILLVRAKSSGLVPDAANPIYVAIQDNNGFTFRSRAAEVLSGKSQFTLTNALWGRTPHDGVYRTAAVYAIWSKSDSKIVWALASATGFRTVPTTTTITNLDYFLLEDDSTYTRAGTDRVACVGELTYEYDTDDTPDYTLTAAPDVLYSPPPFIHASAYPAADITATGNIADQSIASLVIKQTGNYLLTGYIAGGNNTVGCVLEGRIKTGSATYGSAYERAYTIQQSYHTATQHVAFAVIAPLKGGDIVHLGAAITAASNTSTIVALKSRLTIARIG